MSITIKAISNTIDNTTMFVNNNEEEKSSKHKNSFFVGENKNIATDKIIEQKRNQAKKQAMKLIEAAWNSDIESDNAIEQMKQQHSQILKDVDEAKSILANIDKEKENLKEKYGVEDDSQEQKDLELLQRYQDRINHVSDNKFTEEELARLKELENVPRTEYQNEVLKLNNSSTEYKSTIYTAEEKLKSISESIFDTRIDQLKSQEMADANEVVEAIMDNLSKEIIGILRKDAKDNIDEVAREEEKKAEEAKEAKEEEEEKLEAIKEHKEEQEELTEKARENSREQEEIISEINRVDMLVQSNNMSKISDKNIREAQKNIQKLIQNTDILDEDIKGIKIDFNF